MKLKTALTPLRVEESMEKTSMDLGPSVQTNGAEELVAIKRLLVIVDVVL